MSIAVVDETVESVAGVWRHGRERALAFGVGAASAICGAAFSDGMTEAAAVAAGVIIGGLALLVDKLRQPIYVPMRPESELRYIEGLLLNIRSRPVTVEADPELVAEFHNAIAVNNELVGRRIEQLISEVKGLPR